MCGCGRRSGCKRAARCCPDAPSHQNAASPPPQLRLTIATHAPTQHTTLPADSSTQAAHARSCADQFEPEAPPSSMTLTWPPLRWCTVPRIAPSPTAHSASESCYYASACICSSPATLFAQCHLSELQAYWNLNTSRPLALSEAAHSARSTAGVSIFNSQ